MYKKYHKIFIGKHECVELLLRRGANVNERTIVNTAVPLHEAAKKGDYRMCEILLEYKVTISIYHRERIRFNPCGKKIYYRYGSGGNNKNVFSGESKYFG